MGERLRAHDRTSKNNMSWNADGCMLVALKTLNTVRFRTKCYLGETLENPAHLRENSPVIAGMDRVDGRQAAWLW